MRYRSSLYCVGISALLAVSGCSQQGAPKDQKGFGQRGGRGGQGGAVVNIRTTTLQRITLQRTADHSGTLVSPDQARVSNTDARAVQIVPLEIVIDVR